MPGYRPLFIDLIAWSSSSIVIGASSECAASKGNLDKDNEFRKSLEVFSS